MKTVNRAAALCWIAPLSLALCAAPAIAQGTTPAAAVKGTPQLPGDVGTVGTTYTLGKGDDAYNLTIHKFYFLASRLKLNGSVVYPDADKKFLVFDYTIQNPNSAAEFRAYSQTFAMTAVDALNQNYELQGDAENTTTHQPLDISLKPGQRVEGRMYFIVPAATPVPKIILNYNGPKVMRFDLHGIVAPVELLLADPLDKTGATALATLPAKVGVTYPTGQYDFTLESLAYSSASIGGDAPEEGKRYLVLVVRVKNALSANQGDVDINNGNGFDVYALDTDGDKEEFNRVFVKASSDEQLPDTNVTTGVERRFRLLVLVPTSGMQSTLTVTFGDAYRKLVYPLTGVQ